MRPVTRALALALCAALLVTATPAFGARRINAISFSDANRGFMVGGSTSNPRLGSMSVTQDGGASWQAVQLDNFYAMGVSAGSGTTAWSVGDFASFPRFTENDGGSWQTAADKAPGDSLDLADVAVFSGGRVVAVGTRTSGHGPYATLSVSANGGDSWTEAWAGPQYPPDGEGNVPPTDARFLDVESVGNVGWAVGWEMKPGATKSSAVIVKTTDGGATWNPQTYTVPPADVANINPLFTSVAAADTQVAYAAGAQSWVIKTTNGGTTWARSASIPVGGSPSTMKVIDLDCVDANTVVAVGEQGQIARTTNGGASWVKTTVGSPTTLFRDVAVVTPQKWIAVGDDETIYRTENAGANWTADSTTPLAPDVAMTSPAAGFPLTTAQLAIAGTASDKGVGVAAVEVQIKRADGKYFDGVGWTAAVAWVPAETSDGWKTWSYLFTPDVATVNGGLLTISSRATDGLDLTKVTVPITSANDFVGTALNLTTASTTTLAYGAKGTVAGALKQTGGAACPGQTVVLQTSFDNVTFNNTSYSVVTNSSGSFSFPPVGPTTTRYYRVTFAGSPGYFGATSASMKMDPKASLATPSSSSSTVYHGKTYTWSTTLKPTHAPGAPVKFYFQRYSSGAYRAYKTVTVYSYNTTSGYSKAKYAYKIPYAGKWRVRAYHNDADHAATYSSYVYKTVK